MNAIFQLLNPNNTVSVNRPLAHAIGLNEAVVYGALVAKYYWYSDRGMLDDGWFYSTAPDLQESTALTEKQQKRCVDAKGSGSPVFGIKPVTTHIFTKLWKPINAAIPLAINRPAMSFARLATNRHSMVIRNSNTIIITLPIKPISSPTIEKIKSVCGSDIKLPFLTETIFVLLSPLPQSCPEPTAIIEFCC